MWRQLPPNGTGIREGTARTLDLAITSLGKIRSKRGAGDVGVQLRLLARQLAVVESRPPGAVPDAGDEQHSWAGIGARPGVTRARARQRYASRTAKDRTSVGD